MKELHSGKVEITSQNHGFAVDPAVAAADVTVTHENLYDGTVEGFRHTDEADLLGAVPPRGVAGPARRRLSVPAVPRLDGEAVASPMPKRTDIKRVLVIGSGPIVIGQACEFDYSGTQACKALRAEGLEVVLVNSNPATIMTDPELADQTYVEPLTPEVVEAIIEKERPDAVLPTVGGQTALNLAVALHERGILAKYGVKLIGASIDAIKVAEDRLLFRNAMGEIGVEVPTSGVAKTLEEALAHRRRRSAFRPSSARRSRWAASAAASPTTSRSSASWPAAASTSARCTRSWSRSRSSAGRNSSSR